MARMMLMNLEPGTCVRKIDSVGGEEGVLGVSVSGESMGRAEMHQPLVGLTAEGEINLILVAKDPSDCRAIVLQLGPMETGTLCAGLVDLLYRGRSDRQQGIGEDIREQVLEAAEVVAKRGPAIPDVGVQIMEGVQVGEG